MNGLLTFRADRSAKCVFGEYRDASLIDAMPALSTSAPETAVTLTGRLCASAGIFSAVTITGGSANLLRGGGVEAVCAAAGAAHAASIRTQNVLTFMTGQSYLVC